MKTIILVRHGKSSWDLQVEDKDRPLKERGINDARIIASKVAYELKTIDAVYSSHANRATHTALIFMRILGLDFNQFRITKKLYDFSGDSVLSFIQSLDDSLQKVMLFGHNNAFTSLANALGDAYIENVPTSGYVQISFDVEEWKAVAKGKTTKILTPKDFK